MGFKPGDFRAVTYTDLIDAVALHQHEKWHDRQIAALQIAALSKLKPQQIRELAGDSPFATTAATASDAAAMMDELSRRVMEAYA